MKKKNRQTSTKNYKGFNQTDASYLSVLAEKVENGETLTPRELKFIKLRLKTYKQTQWLDVLQELGYIEVKILPNRKKEFYFNEDAFKTDTGVELETVVPTGEQDYVAAVLALAQNDKGILDDEDLEAAKRMAIQFYHSGLISPQDAADKINEEF